MNYIGSKYSILDFLYTAITDVTGHLEGKVFADLFAGTGVVGAKFRENGSFVIANDFQHYSYAINRHLIGNPADLPRDKIDYLNSLSGVEGFVYNNYCQGSGSGRIYFTDENGKKCDAVRQELQRMYDAGEISDDQYWFCLASVLNSIDKYANTASVYGAHLKHIKKAAEKRFVIEPLAAPDGPLGRVYNQDVSDLIEEVRGEVLYLDPPYNARQYNANYHLLETISRYDSPALMGKTGLRKETARKSGFCSKRNVAGDFETIIRRANFKYIFLSYNNEGLMSFETIRNIMQKYGRYDVVSKDHRRFRADKEANRKHKAKKTTEYLHCLVKYTNQDGQYAF